ncbi:anti-sigma-K factor rskA [Chitinophaga dinghuensis]|uniref:Anti-sigma-K factor rskA n=1 Tax=Chitinophaga dinghuensis TaxID=1539050 RepID=A0A327WC75_9BACT|nr:anti-sigma factor [Chitinophaga dinghuensis]RAJ87728.1 anti-sigma-K factor rskA [Chitinophaga dinghuensis]
MDINRYISSGVLESYVYGLLPDEEHSEVEAIVLRYPEVRLVVNNLQQQLEDFVHNYAVTPPPALKAQLLDMIHNESTPEGEALLPEELRLNTHMVSNQKAAPPPAAFTAIPGKKKARDRIWKYLAAACILILVISASINLFLLKDSTDYKGRYQRLIAAQQKIDADKSLESNQTASFRETEGDESLMNDPAVIWVKTSGYGHHNAGAASLGWDKKSREVYFINWQLPEPPENKQFHIWSVSDHQLQDAGMPEINRSNTGKLQHMRRVIENPKAFVITLEPKGDSTGPDDAEIFQTAKFK